MGFPRYFLLLNRGLLLCTELTDCGAEIYTVAIRDFQLSCLSPLLSGLRET